MVSKAFLDQLENNEREMAQDPNDSVFITQTANEWIEQASKRPASRKIFDVFWYEGELCMLFADTNVGKSVLAVQIADAISKGRNIGDLKVEVGPQKVAYIDFEHTDKQFEGRYSPIPHALLKDRHVFDNNFLRAEINPDCDIPVAFQSFEEYVTFAIAELVAETECKIVIVDNITFLRSETEKAKDALPLMKELKALKKRFDLSMLVLAHTPKRNLQNPIGQNDVQGSKMIINFADSAFAIGESIKDSAFRYLKQIKCRNAAIAYPTEHVLLAEIRKPESFLGFEFLGTANERDHLKVFTDSEKAELKAKVVELSKRKFSCRRIAIKLGISAMTVSRYLRKSGE